jgi:hypothetical protein
MRRQPTLSERILLAVATAALVAWCLFVIVVALGYPGPADGRTWVVRLGLLTIGSVITAALVWLGIRGWGRAIARPLPGRRSSRWLARQPGWRLAIGYWTLYGAPELGVTLSLSERGHESETTLRPIFWLVTSVLAACLGALLCRVLWMRQAQNSPPAA